MPNDKSVGIAYSDPALVAGTTITGAVINGSVIGATTPAAATVTTFAGARTTVAALGSTNADAAPIAAATSFCVVTAADGTKGVILPTMVAGQQITVKNNSAAILKIYPFSAAAINGLTVTTGALSMAANTIATFVCDTTTQVWSLPLLPS